MEIYCTQLGMIISLSYCLEANDGKLPCRRLIDCWKDRTDIARLLENLTEEAIRKAFGDLPKTRMEKIMESLRLAGSLK